MTDKKDKLAKIKLLAMDVDGTLTNGDLMFLNGEQLKAFNVYDGLGVRLALTNNLQIAWLTGNVSPTVAQRAQSLGLTEVQQGVRNKAQAVSQLAQKYELATEEIAYVGDDLNDYPAFEVAGFKFAVANAADEIKNASDYTTRACGGKGAVREVIEVIFKAKGVWEDVVSAYIEKLKMDRLDDGVEDEQGNIA